MAMTYVTCVTCPHCQQYQDVSKNGRVPTGIQRFLCNCCHRSFQLEYMYNGNKPDTHEKIIEMPINGSGVRDTGRVMKISINTVIAHLNKKNYARAKWSKNSCLLKRIMSFV